MNAKHYLFVILISAVSFSLKAQSFNGTATTALGANTFNTLLNSGAYLAPAAQTGHPDQVSSKYLLNIKRNTAGTSQQFQISATSATDDKFYFRVVNIASNPNGKWYEMATRGTNTFIGAQVIKEGSITIDQGKSIYFGPNTSGGHKMRIYSDATETRFAFYDTKLHFAPGNSRKLTIDQNGYVGIGTQNPKNPLDVNGIIHAKEVKVDLNNWSDFVFEDDYELLSLDEVKSHIKANKHLPGIPSEKDVKENGISVGEMNAKLLQKIEELTLYTLQQQELIEKMGNEIKELQSKVN